MGSQTIRQYPYPLGPDVPDVPADLLKLAQYLDKWVPLVVAGQIVVACNASGAFTADFAAFVPVFPFTMPAPPTAYVAMIADTTATGKIVIAGPIGTWTNHSVTGNVYTAAGASVGATNQRLNIACFYAPAP